MTKVLVTNIKGPPGDPGEDASASVLDDLTDVDTTGASDGDFLSRVGGVWTPVDAPAGGSPTTLNALTDVDTTGAVTGDLLGLVGGVWVPVDAPVGGGGGAGTAEPRWMAPASAAVVTPSTNLSSFSGLIDGIQEGEYNTGTYQSVGQYFSLDLGAPLKTSGFRVVSNHSTDWPKGFEILGSETGAFAGEEVVLGTMTPTASGTYDVLYDEVEYRYIRMRLTVSSGSYHLRMNQFALLVAPPVAVGGGGGGGGAVVDSAHITGDGNTYGSNGDAFAVLDAAHRVSLAAGVGDILEATFRAIINAGSGCYGDMAILNPTTGAIIRRVSPGAYGQGFLNNPGDTVCRWPARIDIEAGDLVGGEVTVGPVWRTNSSMHIYELPNYGWTLEAYTLSPSGGTAGGGASTLDELTDVDLTDAIDGQLLGLVDGVWIPVEAPAGGAGGGGSGEPLVVSTVQANAFSLFSPSVLTGSLSGLTDNNRAVGAYNMQPGSPAVLTLDFHVEVSWGTINWLLFYGDGRTYQDVQLEGSNDGTSWTDIRPAADYQPLTDGIDGLDIVVNASWRYLRFTTHGSDSFPGSNEWIEISGSAPIVIGVDGSGTIAGEIQDRERFGNASLFHKAATAGYFYEVVDFGVGSPEGSGYPEPPNPDRLVTIPEDLMAGWWGDNSQGTPTGLWLEPGVYSFDLVLYAGINTADPAPTSDIYGYAELYPLLNPANDGAWCMIGFPGFTHSGPRRGVIVVESADYYFLWLEGETNGTNELTLSCQLVLRELSLEAAGGGGEGSVTAIDPWDPEVDYTSGAYSTLDGSIYKALVDNTNVEPLPVALPHINPPITANAADWQLNGATIEGDALVLNGSGAGTGNKSAIYKDLIDLDGLDVTFVVDNTASAGGFSLGLLDPANTLVTSVGGNHGAGGLQGFSVVWTSGDDGGFVRAYYDGVQIGADLGGEGGAFYNTLRLTVEANGDGSYDATIRKDGTVVATRTFTPDFTQARFALGGGTGWNRYTAVTSFVTPEPGVWLRVLAATPEYDDAALVAELADHETRIADIEASAGVTTPVEIVATASDTFTTTAKTIVTPAEVEAGDYLIVFGGLSNGATLTSPGFDPLAGGGGSGNYYGQTTRVIGKMLTDTSDVVVTASAAEGGYVAVWVRGAISGPNLGTTKDGQGWGPPSGTVPIPAETLAEGGLRLVGFGMTADVGPDITWSSGFIGQGRASKTNFSVEVAANTTGGAGTATADRGMNYMGYTFLFDPLPPETLDSVLADHEARIVTLEESGGSGGGGSDSEVLDRQVLAGGETVITFDGIEPGDGSLVIDLDYACSEAATITVRFNNDSGLNYAWVRDYSTTSGPGGSGEVDNSWIPAASTAAAAPAGGSAVITIQNYAGSVLVKRLNSEVVRSDGDDSPLVMQYAGHWSDTDPITRLDVITSAGTFSAGTTAILRRVGGSVVEGAGSASPKLSTTKIAQVYADTSTPPVVTAGGYTAISFTGATFDDGPDVWGVPGSALNLTPIISSTTIDYPEEDCIYDIWVWATVYCDAADVGKMVGLVVSGWNLNETYWAPVRNSGGGLYTAEIKMLVNDHVFLGDLVSTPGMAVGVDAGFLTVNGTVQPVYVFMLKR